MRTFASILIFGIFILSSCDKQQLVNVQYQASQAESIYRLSYRNEFGNIADTLITPQSKEDIWQYSMKLLKGDIFYLSGKYNDSNSSLKLSILINGKIYKEQYSVGDTVDYCIVSGTVPY